ncbi:MAG: hypothetical protein V9G04_11975 [Nocardioides sp.]
MNDSGSWWRRNLWGLLALPLAAGVFAAGGADRVLDLQRAQKVTVQERVDVGEWAELDSSYEDILGRMHRELRVKLESVGNATADGDLDWVDPPAQGRAVAFKLRWEAAPDQVVAGCRAFVYDEEGREYQALNPAGVDCVPLATPGPYEPLPGATERDPGHGDPRPGRWTTTIRLVLPDDVTAQVLRLQWTGPDALEFRLPG